MSKNLTISQNFLTSRKTIDRLISKTTLSGSDTVLEIGAGKGHITKALSKRCQCVISYELDQSLYAKLNPQLKDNVKLYNADFLKCKLPKQQYKVFANIPFSRTSEIIKKLTAYDNLPTAIWLIMEKGAAKRFLGLPTESPSSLLLKPFYDGKIIWHFDREDFHPAPRVDTVLLELKLKQQYDISPHQRSAFSAFINHSIRYGIYGSHALLTKKQVSTALRLARLPQIQISGDISYIQWLCLFRCWQTFGKTTGGVK